MKYKRMLCWVRPHEKKELKEAVKRRFPLVFAKNYDDFKNQITDDSYLIISLSKAKFGFTKLKSLQKDFPLNKFHFYTLRNNEYLSASQFHIMDEENFIPGQYNAKEFVDNFCGIIPDLYKSRENEKNSKKWKKTVKNTMPKIISKFNKIFNK